MQLENLLAQWPIGAVEQTSPVSSHWQSTVDVRTTAGERFALKCRQSGATPASEHALLRRLCAAGLCVAVPLATRAGPTWLQYEDELYELLPWLPGRRGNDVRDADARGWAARLGAAIAHAHRALLHAGIDASTPRLEPLASLRGWIAPAIQRHPVGLDAARLSDVVASVQRAFAGVADALPVQTIHRDLHPDNLLFEDRALTAVLDFELSCVGPRLFDLAYCGSSILLADWAARPQRALWPALFTAMLAAYDSANPLLPVEREAVLPTLCLVELMFIAHAAENGDTDGAKTNQSALFWLLDNRKLIGV